MKEEYKLITDFLDELIIVKGYTQQGINEALVFICKEQDLIKENEGVF
jgi:hypothetical protein